MQKLDYPFRENLDARIIPVKNTPPPLFPHNAFESQRTIPDINNHLKTGDEIEADFLQAVGQTSDEQVSNSSSGESSILLYMHTTQEFSGFMEENY